MLTQILTAFLLTSRILCPASAITSFTLDDAKSAFASYYAPIAAHSGQDSTTPSPGYFIPKWDSATKEISRRGRKILYHVQIAGERSVFAYRRDNKKDRVLLNQELIVEKDIKDGIEIYIKSSIPASADSQKYSGLVIYSDINTHRPYIWETWKNGKCIDAFDNRLDSDKSLPEAIHIPYTVTYTDRGPDYDIQMSSAKGPRVSEYQYKKRKKYSPARDSQHKYYFGWSMNPCFKRDSLSNR